MMPTQPYFIPCCTHPLRTVLPSRSEPKNTRTVYIRCGTERHGTTRIMNCIRRTVLSGVLTSSVPHCWTIASRKFGTVYAKKRYGRARCAMDKGLCGNVPYCAPYLTSSVPKIRQNGTALSTPPYGASTLPGGPNSRDFSTDLQLPKTRIKRCRGRRHIRGTRNS